VRERERESEKTHFSCAVYEHEHSIPRVKVNVFENKMKGPEMDCICQSGAKCYKYFRVQGGNDHYVCFWKRT
jgi:hypothetical protein